MKKTYLAPALEEQTLHTEQIIASSVVTVSIGGTTIGEVTEETEGIEVDVKNLLLW